MTLEGVFNHLVLPPKLPGGQDPDLDEEAQEFVTRLVAAVVTLDKATNKAYTQPLSSLSQSLQLCGQLNRGCLDKDKLAAAFKDLGDAPLILYVAEQNAALIIRQSRQVLSNSLCIVRYYPSLTLERQRDQICRFRGL